MKTRRLLPLLLALCALPLRAETHLLDDSQSYTDPPAAQMEWLPQTPGDRDGGMETWVRANIRIDTREWIGRKGAIYMALLRDQSSSVEATWTTGGTLRPGRVTSGERTLVWAGVIGDDALTDVLQVRLRSGPDWQSASRRLNFQFELDTD